METSTTNRFLAMTHSYFSLHPTLAIHEVMKTSIFNSLIALTCFLVLLDPKLSCHKKIKDKTLLHLMTEIKNMDILEYILRSLLCNIS